MDKHFFLKSLSIKRPSVFTQYNYEFLPDTFTGTDLLTIQCYKHDLFQQKAYNHLYGHGCPSCAIEKNGVASRLTINEFIDKSRDKFGNKYDYSKTIYVRKDIDIIITCPNHGDFLVKPIAHLWSKHGCPKCDKDIPRAIRKKKLLEKAKMIHGDKYDYSKVTYGGFSDKVEIICKKHGSFQQTLWHHVNVKLDCPSCAVENDRLTTEQFITKAKEKHGDKYDYSESVYKTGSKPITVICKKHGHFTQRASSHLEGVGCIECSKEVKKLSSQEFIQNAKKVHGDKYDYSKVKYNGNKRPVEIICPVHGSFWQKPNSHVSAASGCQLCCESKGEKYLEKILNKYDIGYIREYKINPYSYRYDFFIPEFNIFIEYNGIQHYVPVRVFGGEKAWVKTQANDKFKKNLVRQLKGRLIIITYRFANLENIEKELIRLLKIVYPYWFIVHGKIRAFKTTFDVLTFFDISDNIPIEELVSFIEKTKPGIKVLF